MKYMAHTITPRQGALGRWYCLVHGPGLRDRNMAGDACDGHIEGEGLEKEKKAQ